MKANLHTNESYFCVCYSPTSSFILFSEPQGCIRHEELLLDRKLVSISHKEKKQQNFSQSVLGYSFALKHLRKNKRGTKRLFFFCNLKRWKNNVSKSKSKCFGSEKWSRNEKRGNPLGLPQNFRGHNSLKGCIAKWYFTLKPIFKAKKCYIKKNYYSFLLSTECVLFCLCRILTY